MVNTNDSEYKKLKKKERDLYLDKLKANVDNKLDDVQVLIDMITNYKNKLAIERSKN